MHTPLNRTDVGGYQKGVSPLLSGGLKGAHASSRPRNSGIKVTRRTSRASLTGSKDGIEIDEVYGARLRKHCNNAFLVFYYCYSQLLARAYLRNCTYVEDFEDTTEISKNRTSWPYKHLNFDKMRRKGGLSRDGHICYGPLADL